ncbi:MAG: hypothetical protein HY879_15990 [Deltaproteobacteria bacterium]|nr:hypothetical protein [Deltaproteobacteria bacterium]
MADDRFPILRDVSVWVFWLGLLFLTWVPSALSEEISCEAEIKFQDGGKHLIDLKLILEKNLIVGLVFHKIESFTAKGNPMALWTCSVDTTNLDEDHRIKWSRKGNRTTFEIFEKDTGDTSAVRIDKTGKGYKVSFVEMSHYYSGMTQYPASVLIEKGIKECAVTPR